LEKSFLVVENKLNNKPNLLELESLRAELIEKTLSTNSNFFRLYLYQNYFEIILDSTKPNLEEAFLKEFLDDYISCISKFEVWGIEPAILKNILDQIKKVGSLKIASETLTSLKREIDRIENQFEKFKSILEGKEVEDGKLHEAYFPLIDKEAPAGYYGIIESITVRINKAANDDKYIIIPSEKEIEKKILEQCKNSWVLALNLSKEYVKKPYKYHEVIICFDKKEGFYEGNSLGIALTLSFLEQILKFYNPAYIINIKEQSAFTGGVTEAGEVLCTSEEIIKRKVAAVFFSEINTFVFPKCEETYAYFALTQLKKSYPERKLKLIPVEEIKDVLNRRDVVDIKKQKLVVRSGKFVKKNKISFGLLTLFFLLIFFYFSRLDRNPVSVELKGNIELVLNKYGQILLQIPISDATNRAQINSQSFDFFDIDSDGVNEVFWGDNVDNLGYIYCANIKGDTLKRYSLEQNIFFVNNQNTIKTFLFTKLKIHRKKSTESSSLYILASSPFSLSYLLEIDLHNCKTENLLVNSGHILDFQFIDLYGDGINEIIISGISNDWEGGLFAVIDESDFDGQVILKNSNYKTNKRILSHLKSFFIFPMSIVGKQVTKDHNWNSINDVQINRDAKQINLAISEGIYNNCIVQFYVIMDYNLNILNFNTSDIYDKIAKQLYNEGSIKYRNINEYLDTEYRKKILMSNNLTSH
jgi:hypothetical protein